MDSGSNTSLADSHPIVRNDHPQDSLDANQTCDKINNDVGNSNLPITEDEQVWASIPVPQFQAIDISIGSRLNAAVQQDLGRGLLGKMSADVGLTAEPVNVPIAQPQAGMCFTTCLHMLAMCHSYAKQVGFQFSIRSSGWRRQGQILVEEEIEDTENEGEPDKRSRIVCQGKSKKKKQTRTKRSARDFLDCIKIVLACKKAGEFVSKGKNKTRIPRTGKCKCPVILYGSIGDDGFKITSSQMVHNHELASGRTRLMVNYRVIGLQEQEKLLTNYYAGIPISRNYKSLSVWVGGPANLKFTENDARNFIKGEKLKGKINGDASAMLSYFNSQRTQNSNFYCNFEKDDEDRLVNVFWADARCRTAFNDFDEIVTFDTTHLSNEYGMPLAMFVGVNHHGSSFLFALALISNEDKRTFRWVFNEWLKCMGRPPKAFLSDQCKGINGAVAEVFPGIPHRLCIWHILQNARRNLGAINDFQHVYAAINVAVHDSWSLIEFEELWKDMEQDFDLGGNSWIKDTYDHRHRWVPAEWRGTFCAGMSSTQRSEQTNRFMKISLNSNTGLAEFMRECDRNLARKAEDETQLNNDSYDRPLHPGTNDPIVMVFHRAYTNNKFEEFLREYNGLNLVNAAAIDHEDSVAVYEVTERVEKPAWKKRWRTFQVTISKEEGEFLCSCRLFEFRGILCKHIIKAMIIEDIEIVPEKYVLRRWQKNIVRDYEKIKLSYYDPEMQLHLQNYRRLSSLYDQIVAIVIGDDDAYATALEEAKASLMKFQAASVLASAFLNVGTEENPCSIDLNTFGRRKVVMEGLVLASAATEVETENLLVPVKKKRHGGRAQKGRIIPFHERGSRRKKKPMSTRAPKASAPTNLRATKASAPTNLQAIQQALKASNRKRQGQVTKQPTNETNVEENREVRTSRRSSKMEAIGRSTKASRSSNLRSRQQAFKASNRKRQGQVTKQPINETTLEEETKVRSSRRSSKMQAIGRAPKASAPTNLRAIQQALKASNRKRQGQGQVTKQPTNKTGASEERKVRSSSRSSELQAVEVVPKASQKKRQREETQPCSTQTFAKRSKRLQNQKIKTNESIDQQESQAAVEIAEMGKKNKSSKSFKGPDILNMRSLDTIYAKND